MTHGFARESERHAGAAYRSNGFTRMEMRRSLAATGTTARAGGSGNKARESYFELLIGVDHHVPVVEHNTVRCD
jgi:hypothetical protein